MFACNIGTDIKFQVFVIVVSRDHCICNFCNCAETPCMLFYNLPSLNGFVLYVRSKRFEARMQRQANKTRTKQEER